jgi:hypothetical protein
LRYQQEQNFAISILFVVAFVNLERESRASPKSPKAGLQSATSPLPEREVSSQNSLKRVGGWGTKDFCETLKEKVRLSPCS